MNLAQKMRRVIPNLTLSTDLICGFCGETDQQFFDVSFYLFRRLGLLKKLSTKMPFFLLTP